MTSDERDKRLKRLLERGNKKYVLFDDIAPLLPEGEDGGPELDYVLSAFESAGVEVVEEPSAPSCCSELLEYFDADDSVRMYLNEVCKVPPLTREREVELAKLLRTGPPEAENAELQFVESNLWRVVAVARRHADRCNVHILDLIQEGNKGLLRAVETFDYSRGYAFSTYATWCARQAIIRAASRGTV